MAENMGIAVAWCWVRILAQGQSPNLWVLSSFIYNPGISPRLLELPKF